MRDELADLLARDAVGERALQVPGELVAAVQGHQRGNGDEAAIALGETRPLPDVAVDHGLRQLDEPRGHLPDFVARRRCRLRNAHGRLLSGLMGYTPATAR